MAYLMQICTIVQTLAFEDPSSSAVRVCAETDDQVQEPAVWFHPQLQSVDTDNVKHKKLPGRGTEFFSLPLLSAGKHDYGAVEEECRRCLASFHGKNKWGRFFNVWIRQKIQNEQILSWQQSRLNSNSNFHSLGSHFFPALELRVTILLNSRATIISKSLSRV